MARSASGIDSEGRRRRVFVVRAAVTFILATIFLCYTQFDPSSPTRSANRLQFLGRPASDTMPDNPEIEDGLSEPQQQDQEDGRGSWHSDDDNDLAPPMTYGTSARPPPKHLIRLATLPASHLPTTTPSSPADQPRLIIIGDVHGELACLRALLSKVGYSRSRRDHVIFAGDLINKGPDSAGVVDLAMSMGASAVRGNHEDKILLTWEAMKRKKEEKKKKKENKEKKKKDKEKKKKEDKKKNKNKNKDKAHVAADPDPDLVEEAHHASDDKGREDQDVIIADEEIKSAGARGRDRATAASLTDAQRAWLGGLPVMLRVGALPGYGEVVVVHAGLVPDLPLERQDLWAVMNMRTLLYPGRHRLRQSIKTPLQQEAAAVAAAVAAPRLPDSDSDSDSNSDSNSDSSPTSRDNHTNDETDNIQISEQATEAELAARLSALSTSADPTDHGGSEPLYDIIAGLAAVVVPSESHDGRPWASAWNEAQLRRRRAEDRTTVVYGHDAKAGLQVREYAFGLDSNCARGGELTALVFEGVAATAAADRNGEGEGEGKESEAWGHGGKKHGGGDALVIKHRLVSVSCGDSEKGGKGKGKGKGKAKGKGNKTKEEEKKEEEEEEEEKEERGL